MICGLLLLMISATVGCGGTSTLNCSMTGINVSPQNASTGHTAPSNVQHFDGFAIAPAGCNSVAITAARLTNITWSTSDPVRVSISNEQGLVAAAKVTRVVVNRDRFIEKARSPNGDNRSPLAE